MRIAVTGGSGLVGRAIVRHLSKSHDVVNVDLRDPGTAGVDAYRDGGTPAAYVPADILDLANLTRAFEGVSAVVHAAAIPGPAFGTEEEILRVNVDGTANVAAAASRADIHRVVFISSESVLGFVFSGGAVRPAYLPVDEDHPLAPAEPYGRSKLRAELALARSADETTSVVCLRPPWVWLPEEYERLRKLTVSPEDWSDGLWAYVHGEDLARAVELGSTLEFEPGFHAAYLAAPDNGTVVPTARLLEEYYGDVPVRGDLPEFGSLLSSDRLHSLLGFRPSMSWREFLK